MAFFLHQASLAPSIAYPKFSLHQAELTPSLAYPKHSLHQAELTPSLAEKIIYKNEKWLDAIIISILKEIIVAGVLYFYNLVHKIIQNTVLP